MRDELHGVCPEDPLSPLSPGAMISIEYGRALVEKIAICFCSVLSALSLPIIVLVVSCRATRYKTAVHRTVGRIV